MARSPRAHAAAAALLDLAIAPPDTRLTATPHLDVLLLLHRRGMRIVEVPVLMAPSPAGHVPLHGGTRAGGP
jgi:hypothetical protein